MKSLDEPQSSTANDSAGATVTPPLADLQVDEDRGHASPNLGTGSFTVTVTNSGPDDATAVTALDLLPAGLTYVSNTASQGSFDSTTGIWTLGALANGASATLTMHVSVVTAGDYTNTASVTHADQYDPNSANNQASASLSTRVADIAVAKTADHATPAVGTDVTFTVTASNGGPDDATQLVIHDPLPAGLDFVSAAPSVGTYSPTTGDWTIGPLANGANATLELKAQVAGSGSIVNTAAVSGLLQRDPDADNDSATASLEVPPAAEFSLSKDRRRRRSQPQRERDFHDQGHQPRSQRHFGCPSDPRVLGRPRPTSRVRPARGRSIRLRGSGSSVSPRRRDRDSDVSRPGHG